MPRRYRNRKNQENPIVTLFGLGAFGLAVGVWQQQQMLIVIFGTAFVIALIVIGYIVYDQRRKQAMLVQSGIAEIDKMSGIQFEEYLRLLLMKRGFRNVTLTTTYDLGIDLIAEKDGVRWGIQAKRYKGTVGLDSVRQVVAAANHYNCTKTMVITNSYFTKNAQTIAASTDCTLINRDELIKLILEDKNS